MADVADDLLPVFPFRINWKGGLAERLEWKTDILPDMLGNEQRRGLRLTPRREFEATLTIWDRERSFLDLWLHRLGDGEFLCPLWHDSVRAATEAAQGQNTVQVDTRGLEFRIGSYALLRGLTALSWERVQIAEVHEDRIVTVAPLERTWPGGTRVEPLIRGRMTPETKATLHGSRAAEAQIVVQATREQPYDMGVDSSPIYLGLPVLVTGPNRTDALDLNYLWTFHEADSGTGRRYRRTDNDRAITTQKHSWLLRGRTGKSEFRSFVYRLMGALKPTWVPTFSDDLKLAQDAPNGAASIYVEEIGFGYTGGPSSGREHIAIRTTAGWLFRRITGTAAAPPGQERLVLNAPLPATIRRADVRMISWMDTARLENDRVEFVHVNAADGATTMVGILRTFRNSRAVPAVLEYSIPLDFKFAGPCGQGAIQGFVLRNPSFDDGTVGWTGPMVIVNSNTANNLPPVDGPNVAWAGNNAQSEFYQQLAVPDRWFDWIDSGQAQITGFAAYHSSYTQQTDHGHLFVEFRNGAGQAISRAVSPDSYAQVWTLVRVPTAAIPPGTRSIRFGAHSKRDQGVENNNYWDAMTPGYLQRIT